MYDMVSVRSVPSRPSRRVWHLNSPSQLSIFSNSNTPNNFKRKNWKDNLLPEISEKYNDIINGRSVSWIKREGQIRT